MAQRDTSYQVLLTALLSLNFGIVLFDRNALGFLMPFIQPQLRLSNTQVGILASGLSLTWAFAAFGIGAIADRFGSRKRLLVLSTLVFALCSFGSGLAISFGLMLAARLVMGLAEGGIMPLSQSLIAAEVSPRHRGLAMGVAQGFGSSLLGSFVAPVLLVSFATHLGWRPAFFLAGAPGVMTSLLMLWLIRDSTQATAHVHRETSRASADSLRAVLSDRNVILCALLGVLLVSYLVVCWAFMPLFLTRVRGYDPPTMGWLMGTLGISATIASFAIPAVSDRIGRRPMMIVMPLLAVILPLAALYFTGSIWTLAAMFVVGWAVTGIFPLFMATVPAESVAAGHIATALGVCMGTGEVLGGVLSPFAAGYAADRVGLQAPVWIMLGLAAASCVLALGLRETAPRVLAYARANASVLS
jgi:ACS family hexuronate transporter-like MFS transporter